MGRQIMITPSTSSKSWTKELTLQIPLQASFHCLLFWLLFTDNNPGLFIQHLELAGG